MYNLCFTIALNKKTACIEGASAMKDSACMLVKAVWNFVLPFLMGLMEQSDICTLAVISKFVWELCFPYLQAERQHRREHEELCYLLDLPSPRWLELEQKIEEEEKNAVLSPSSQGWSPFNPYSDEYSD